MVDTQELDALKQVNLADVVERFTTLRKASGREFYGPCPRAGCDADEDGFHVGRRDNGSWWWFCRKCHGERGDIVEFGRWLHGYDFPQAVAWAHGGIAVVEAKPRKPVHTVATARAWDVAEVERKIDAACRALANGDGDLGAAGRAYLAKRALTVSVAERFFLGAHMTWDRELRHARPALSLPWARADVVTAIKYRFCEVPTGGMKMTSESGSRFDGMFGRNALGGAYDVLVVCEGEINGMSVHQAARQAGWPWVDAVSVGGEGAALSATTVAAVAELAGDFKRVLMWLDKPDYAAALRDAVPGAQAIRSHDDGVKYDANELLQRDMLQDFMGQVFGRLWPILA